MNTISTKASIYAIYCLQDGKTYIGKTSSLISKRFNQHIRDAAKSPNRHLYRAMNKYGKKKFICCKIQECNETEASSVEQQWIRTLNTFENGFNETLGGDGRLRVSRKDVIFYYNKLKNVKSVATELNIDVTTVRNILRNSGIKIDSSSEVMKREKGKQVISTNFYTGERIVHDTISDAFEYVKTIYPNQEAILNNPGGYREKIIECCRGKRRFFPSEGAYKLSWQAVNPDILSKKHGSVKTEKKSVTIMNTKTKQKESFKSVRLCAKKIHNEYPNESFDRLYSILRRTINMKQVNTPYGYQIVY